MHCAEKKTEVAEFVVLTNKHLFNNDIGSRQSVNDEI